MEIKDGLDCPASPWLKDHLRAGMAAYFAKPKNRRVTGRVKQAALCPVTGDVWELASSDMYDAGARDTIVLESLRLCRLCEDMKTKASGIFTWTMRAMTWRMKQGETP